MKAFVYDQPPTRVVFGEGVFDRLSAEVERLGAARVLVISTPGRRALAEAAAAKLGARAAGILATAEMHVPIATAQAARAEAARLRADALLAVGGGSTVGLAKAVALESGQPIIAVPTTYAGSEMTPIWGLTEGGQKRTGRDRKVLPRAALYDPLLSLDLPLTVAGPSGMNGIAHCLEALYAEDANPVTSLLAEEGIRALSQGLAGIAQAATDHAARGEALYGAYLGGAVLGAVGMALHHKLCHVLGGSFNLPHAETHTVVLPHVAAYNRAAAPEAIARAARALGAKDAPAALYDLARTVGAPAGLKDIGLTAADLDRAAELAVRNPYYNPRPVEQASIRVLLDDAFHGRPPRHS